MLAIIKKEVKSYFLSPIGYIYIGLFLAMSSIFFYLDIFSYGYTKFEYLFYSLATVLTFITPILTMRMFAEEKKTGTDQLLFTSPRSITTIVIAKFISATIMVLISILCTLIYFAILMFFGTPDILPAIITMLGFLLLAMAYISFGMFASSITENQIIAAVITIGFFIITWFLPNLNTTLAPFSLIYNFQTFPTGQIAIDEIIVFVTFILLFISLTILVLQRRKSIK